MLKHLIRNNQSFFWVLFHIVLGGLCILSPWFVILWFYFTLLTSLPSILKRTENHFITLSGLIVYLVSFELIGRMSGTSPFIPYEMGKYLLLTLFTYGIITGYHRGRVGWGMVSLLLPAILIDESSQVLFKNVIFNILGPLNVALAIVYFRRQEISEEDLKSLLRLIALPLVSVLSFVIIKTPDFESIEFKLGPNFQTSGGWGTNQVSTALGLGAFIAFVFWRNRWRLSGYRWFDLSLLFLFVIRGLLTFSRGGMIGGAFGITLLLIYEAGMQHYSWRIKRLLISLAKIAPLVILFIILFRYADGITDGKLTLRYQGETPGTLAGSKEKTLNVVTSNRLNVFMDDFALWKEHPVLGVGVGASLYLRENTRRVAPHVELSRLLSEHGMFGFTYFFILCLLGYKVFRQATKVIYGPILLALFIIALFTTFHSAMRTFISPLLIGLSMLTVSGQTEEATAD